MKVSFQIVHFIPGCGNVIKFLKSWFFQNSLVFDLPYNYPQDTMNDLVEEDL